MTKNWTKDLTAEDMPNHDLQTVANLCGIDVAVKLIEHMGGLPIYIPNRAILALQKKYILKKYDGSRQSIKALALECGVSEAYIYNALRQQRDEFSPHQQLGLFNAQR